MDYKVTFWRAGVLFLLTLVTRWWLGIKANGCCIQANRHATRLCCPPVGFWDTCHPAWLNASALVAEVFRPTILIQRHSVGVTFETCPFPILTVDYLLYLLSSWFYLIPLDKIVDSIP